MCKAAFPVFALCLLAAAPAMAKPQDFRVWLDGARKEALGMGISPSVVAAALPDTLRPVERIIALDRKQPEKTRAFADYQKDIVNAKRVQDGRTLFFRHRDDLKTIGAKYGVDPQFIVALWGVETNFGKNTGGHDVVTALATLAWDGRRGEYFRGEMFKALQIVDEGHIPLKDMKGSWAGAMGQVQFMPSSFFNFAEDYNRDGRRDIWTHQEDVFASAANYLSKSGWIHGEPWGHRIALPAGFNNSLVGTDTRNPLSYWRAKGVTLQGGAALPDDTRGDASIVQPDGPGTAAYLIYDNYRVILKWNRSTYFATAVGMLADKIAE